MTNVQILTIAIALATSFLAVLVGVLMNNTRLNDVKELLAAKVETRAAARGLSQLREDLSVQVEKNLSEMRLLMSDMRVLMEKNHSELLLKIADIEYRLSRIEGERRIVS